MSINSRKLYTILLICSMAGYFWLYISMSTNLTENKTVKVCLIKHVTKIPCPSCGSTRSVISLIKGEFINALWINPLGYIIAIIMILTPIWIVIDLLAQKKTLFGVYKKMETCLKKPQFAIPLICFIIMNWIWNITKGL
ncbi:DUF2752 domain-containing protein [Prolixibacteraceae bacterium JC049]|nr:DUF2752 domain-containing protein [Prolixibacteraceae bacterium JC049]